MSADTTINFNDDNFDEELGIMFEKDSGMYKHISNFEYSFERGFFDSVAELDSYLVVDINLRSIGCSGGVIIGLATAVGIGNLQFSGVIANGKIDDIAEIYVNHDAVDSVIMDFIAEYPLAGEIQRCGDWYRLSY